MPVRDKPIMLARQVAEIDWRGVPYQLQTVFRSRVSALCRSLQDCEDLVHWFGDAEFCPFQPVVLLIPGGQPVSIEGDGYAPAAELRDVAVATWERNTEKLRTIGAYFDFDDARERAGLPDRSGAEAKIREALWERAKRHKASPVTDPPRQPLYPRLNGKTVHPVAESQEWKTTA